MVHGWPRRLRFSDQRAVGCFVSDHGFLGNERITGWLATGKSGINETFPFDPLGMGADSDSMKLKEIKNGRAAMIAFVGICVQALVLREGPLAALQDHVANPFGNNLATNVMNLPINLA